MFSFFARKTSLIRQIESLEAERDKLRHERDEAQSSLSKFQATKKQEEDELKHLLKMDQERAKLERLQHEAKVAKERDEAIGKVKDQYRDKMENELRRQIENAGKMYEQILARLPDVSVKLRGSAR